MTSWKELVIIAAGLILVWNARASDLVSANIDYKHYMGETRFLEARPGKQILNSLGLDLNLSPINPIYWDNRVEMLSDPKPVWVGWNFEAGARFKKVDVYFAHHSQHALDWVGPFWPISDGIGMRWRIYP